LTKAYINGASITLVTADNETVTFAAGSALTTLGEKNTVKMPYELFTDNKAVSLKASLQAALESFYLSSGTDYSALMHLADADQKTYAFQTVLETVDEKPYMAFLLKNSQDLLALEIFCVLNSKKVLKKCEHCGRFFFPTGRSDALYCDRVLDDGFSCKKIGAHRQYRKNSRADDIKNLYDKVTKHNRYLKSKGTLSERDYENWKAEASSMYIGFKNGEVSARRIKLWLTETDVVTSAQPTRRNDISDYLL